ncbi:TrgA family protein [Cereibacter changlensis]|jgi:hypothetical protein|uniref:TrgA family protein n=1 Tax=Cereibacter changlensis TaxID=402884 RepID=A0A4U0YS43_9RHOB|nr:TrgA family protein [Cereibacter changlensis]MBZ4690281.1 hypothetical protein [Cereibacter sp.]TKA94475.1 TrgA family protein [Cereibacter changlensis]
MPTAAKLFAAMAFAAAAYIAAGIYATGLPEGTPTGLLGPVSAALGLVCGWRVSGALAGRGLAAAMGTGVRTSATIAFWALLVFSTARMLRDSTRMIYDGPVEALQGVFSWGVIYGRLLLAPEVLAALVLGGIVGGWLSEWASQRWR